MKYPTPVALALCLFLLSASAEAKVTAFCGFEGLPNEQTVKASDGEVMAVLAAGNPTTGYEWLSQEKIRGTFELDGGPAGSGGVFTFKKKLSLADHGKIFTFVYKRPWENGEPDAICRVKALVR